MLVCAGAVFCAPRAYTRGGGGIILSSLSSPVAASRSEGVLPLIGWGTYCFVAVFLFSLFCSNPVLRVCVFCFCFFSARVVCLQRVDNSFKGGLLNRTIVCRSLLS